MLYAFLTNTIIINHHIRRQMDYNDIGNSEPEIPLHALETVREKKFFFVSHLRGD